MKFFGSSSSERRQGSAGQANGGSHSDRSRAQKATPQQRQPQRAPAPQTRADAPTPKKPKKKGRGWLIALLVLVIIASSMFIYLKITTRPPEVSVPTADPAVTDNPGPDIINTDTREVGRYYTMLVVGEDQLQSNTDTIMVARFDAVERSVNVVSIPRDTLINISGPVKKINTVYYRKGDGGIEGLMDATENLLGFRPDNYVVVKTNVFEQVVDALGGVDFYVPRKMDYDDYTPLPNGESYVFTIHLEEGMQHLDGHEALGVFRWRKNNDGKDFYGDGDIGRLNLQHELIKAIASEAFKLNNLPKLFKVAQIVLENSQTDLKIGNLQWYAQEFMQMDMDNINMVTMPADYFGNIRNLSYVSINVPEWLTLINASLNPMKQPITAEDCNILYQVAYDGGVYNLDPNNYKTTNGSEIAGGLNSFYNNIG